LLFEFHGPADLALAVWLSLQAERRNRVKLSSRLAGSASVFLY
jgi:hypothetical protein